MRIWACGLVALLLLAGCSSGAPHPGRAPAPPSGAPVGEQAATAQPGAITRTVPAVLPQESEPLWIDTVAFATPARGWILFGNGPALETTDGGATWRPASLPQGVQAMAFSDEHSGVARSKTGAFRTTDGGLSWTPIAATAWPEGRIQFVDERHGWIASYDLLATANGGESWARPTTPCPNTWPQPVSFISPQKGWALCGSDEGQGAMSKRLFRTDDGGATWRLLGEALVGPPADLQHGKEWPNGLSVGDYVGMLTFVDDRHGWVTGTRYGSLYATTDGGLTWKQLPSPFAHLTGVTFLDPLNGFATGIQNGYAIAATHDGGLTWQQVYPTLRPVPTFYLDAKSVVGVLGSALYRSADGGGTWAPLGAFPAGVTVTALTYTSPQQAWALTKSGEHQRLYTSGDGGATWKQGSAAPELDRIEIVRPVDDRVAYLWDGCRTLLVTRDGGATLQALPSLDGETCGHGFDFTTADAGWFSREFRLLHTGDGGNTWAEVPLQPSQKPQGVALTPDGMVWALVVDVSNQNTPIGMLLASADQGRTWTRYDLGAFNQPNYVYRCGLTSICVRSGGSGRDIVSHDGGHTWSYRN